jgi:beta-glucosidase
MHTAVSNRRDFLTTSLQMAGAAVALTETVFCRADEPATSSTSKAAATSPLRRPPFYWGVGIENCWIAQADPQKDGKRRLLDVFLQMQHYDKWKEDLDLVKHVGFNCIRYSAPWYKTEPKAGVYDWSWLDRPIEYLVEKLGIVPIMDLIHYGTPAWMKDGIADPRFPEAIGRYAEAMARHYRGLVNHYSPHNEPGLNCQFCGLLGRWPPYRKSLADWAALGLQIAKGMVLETEAIRGALTDAVIVSVDPFFYGVVEPHLPPAAADDPARRELLRAAAAFPASLAYGKVGRDHPFANFLVEHQVPVSEIAWFENRAAKPDILGCNCYPLVAEPKPGEPATGDSADLKARLNETAKNAAELAKKAILDSQTYFDLPVYLTETSGGLTTDAKIAYLVALCDMIVQLRRENVPVVGMNWWPLFETIQWEYREVHGKPLTDFLIPGGWNNGLYLVEPEAGGNLKRVPTGTVAAYRQILQKQLGGVRP